MLRLERTIRMGALEQFVALCSRAQEQLYENDYLFPPSKPLSKLLSKPPFPLPNGFPNGFPGSLPGGFGRGLRLLFDPFLGPFF